MKWEFLPAVTVSVLLYGHTTDFNEMLGKKEAKCKLYKDAALWTNPGSSTP